MSAEVVAPEHRPGHVGHTPQPVGRWLQASRARGILSSTLALLHPQEYILAPYRSPQRTSAASHLHTLMQLEQAARGTDPRQPWPIEYREGFDPFTAPAKGPRR